MTDAGVMVLVALVSPFRASRQMARGLFASGEFIEVFVNTPLKKYMGRDPKGMYAQAQRGDLELFTGVESPYEPPVNPEIRLDTCVLGIEECVDQLYRSLKTIRG